MWIAAVDALVVLMIAATLLPVAVLWRFADEHASIADRGYPVVALWTGVQMVAVAMAEVTGRVVFWWLEPHPRAGLTLRRRRLGRVASARSRRGRVGAMDSSRAMGAQPQATPSGGSPVE
jgi:hypothetical protein